MNLSKQKANAYLADIRDVLDGVDGDVHPQYYAAFVKVYVDAANHWASSYNELMDNHVELAKRYQNAIENNEQLADIANKALDLVGHSSDIGVQIAEATKQVLKP